MVSGVFEHEFWVAWLNLINYLHGCFLIKHEIVVIKYLLKEIQEVSVADLALLDKKFPVHNCNHFGLVSIELDKLILMGKHLDKPFQVDPDSNGGFDFNAIMSNKFNGLLELCIK